MTQGLGLAPFQCLRAEEEPWLAQCFVPPPGFEGLLWDTSVVVFGGAGSGKSALKRMVQQSCYDAAGRPTRLLVPWGPSPIPSEQPAGIAWVRLQAEQVLEASSRALAEHLVQYPQGYQETPTWARDRLAWFLRYQRGEPEALLKPLIDQGLPGSPLLREMLSVSPPDMLRPDAPPEQAIAQLLAALPCLNLQAVWVIVDGLEGWLEVDPEGIARSLGAFLSTLILFNRPEVAYKLFLPSELEGALGRAAGLIRRRLSRYLLQWDRERLRQIVNRRLSLAVGRSVFLEDLCASPDLLSYLERAGGESPREWLNQVLPLVDYYLDQGCRAPIDEATWLALRRKHPPRLYLDERRGRILIGGREESLERLPEAAIKILRYLMDHAGRVVERSELYFKAYLGRDTVPVPGEPGYEGPSSYRGFIDTNLWRLREVLEADPARPEIIVTHRGLGVSLQLRW